MPYAERLPLYQQLEEKRGSRVVTYVTGDRVSAEIQIGDDALDLFANHLDPIDGYHKITLLLYTRGGATLAAWSIANLIRQYTDEFEVIVPVKAHSAGTLIALGADNIVMTKQATLGPIDPSYNSPLNPQVEDATPPNNRFPVSVEAINGYLDFARKELGKDVPISDVLLHLSDCVHPLVLGQCYRMRSQIRMLAKKLLAHHSGQDERNVEPILEFLCSDSGSHDYTINRQEARKLGLSVETPDQDLYDLVKEIHDDYTAELELMTPFSPYALLAAQSAPPAGQPPAPQAADYSLRRGLVESVGGGSDVFVSEGTYMMVQQPGGQVGLQDVRKLEAWRHE